LEPLKAAYIPSTPYVGADLVFSPDFDTLSAPAAPTTAYDSLAWRSMGEFIAWNPATGTKAWSIGEAAPLWGGVLATAGDVVFYGTLDRHFKAVDANTGAILMDETLECGIVGNPITYMGSDGFQRVAIYTGIGWLPGAFAGGSCPAAANDAAADPSLTGRVHVFKLPTLPSAP
jgi:alcohol dehydrogenase (cytochrome c)